MASIVGVEKLGYCVQQFVVSAMDKHVSILHQYKINYDLQSEYEHEILELVETTMTDVEDNEDDNDDDIDYDRAFS